jgi:hypothetical protein
MTMRKIKRINERGWIGSKIKEMVLQDAQVFVLLVFEFSM